MSFSQLGATQIKLQVSYLLDIKKISLKYIWRVKGTRKTKNAFDQ